MHIRKDEYAFTEINLMPGQRTERSLLLIASFTIKTTASFFIFGSTLDNIKTETLLLAENGSMRTCRKCLKGASNHFHCQLFSLMNTDRRNNWLCSPYL